MRKFLTEVFGFLFTPAILVGYVLTHHSGWIFVYGLMNVLGILLYAWLGIVYAYLASEQPDAYKKSILLLGGAKGKWRYLISLVYWAAGLSFMIYEGRFFVATLVFIMATLGIVFFSITRAEYKKLEIEMGAAKFVEAVKAAYAKSEEKRNAKT